MFFYCKKINNRTENKEQSYQLQCTDKNSR